jgi:histone H3/H4
MSNEKEVIVVVSKLKNYIKASGGMNTSGNVAEMLSDIIRTQCDLAIENAKADGRKTVMDRDFNTQVACNTQEESASPVAANM